MIGIILLSVCIMGLTILALAIGPLFSRPCLRGSCATLVDPAAREPDRGCGTCPLRQTRPK